MRTTRSRGLDDQYRAVGAVRNRVRDAAEHTTLHPLVADHQQIGATLGCEPHQHVTGITLGGARLALNAGLAEPRLGSFEDRSHPGRWIRSPLKLNVVTLGRRGAW